MSDLQGRIEGAIANPKNLGEMADADCVGTVGSPDCGDMLRMWVKFREDDQGRKLIDRATFQTFGCQTAIAVASVATELVAGKTVQEALEMSGEELAAPLGALPPMKIHCAQLVEGALRSALQSENASPATGAKRQESEVSTSVSSTPISSGVAPTLVDSFRTPVSGEKKVQVIFKSPSNS
ncbi:MAG: iron-sulfur cluster assembly scaffold protein [Verrucomicrobiota bacterium]